jgi:hypothetical protein
MSLTLQRLFISSVYEMLVIVHVIASVRQYKLPFICTYGTAKVSTFFITFFSTEFPNLIVLNIQGFCFYLI